MVALLPLAFGALGLSFLAGHEAEWMFTLVAVAFAAVALNVRLAQNHSTQVNSIIGSWYRWPVGLPRH